MSSICALVVAILKDFIFKIGINNPVCNNIRKFVGQQVQSYLLPYWVRFPQNVGFWGPKEY